MSATTTLMTCAKTALWTTAALSCLAVAPAAAQVNERCRPGEAAPREGLECLPGVHADGSREWVLDPAQILNARKGDLPLSSGCGFIGQLLTKVDPGQRFSHTGIMIDDRYSIRHSTGSDGRLQDYPVGLLAHLGEPTDGFRSDVLRFVWPGTISQSISGAYEGEFLEDPENGQSYELDAFSDRVGSGCDVQTPPVLIRPAIDEEVANPWVRPALHAAANAAEGIKGHYRFYGYTDGQPFEPAPASAGWAEGTQPTVCSTFVRNALKAADVHLEGRLEATDCVNADGSHSGDVTLDAPCQPGQSIADDAHDGLYMYTREERLDAAVWMHKYYVDKVTKKAGGGGVAFYDVADDIADQITNCFAFDWCGPAKEGVRELEDSSAVHTCIQSESDAKDSNCWLDNPGIGRTVSPDDLMLWDAPSTGGVYGHKQDLALRTSDYVLVHRWQAADGFGSIEGVIRADGLPSYGTEVVADEVSIFTDHGGNYRLDGVQPGMQTVQACHDLDNGLFLFAEGTVQVVAGAVSPLDLDLVEMLDHCPLPITRWSREITVGGEFTIIDDEFWSSNEVETFVVPDETVVLHPIQGADTHIFHFEDCAGDEVTALIDLEVRVMPGGLGVVDTKLKVTLREGSSCSPGDQSVERKFAGGGDVGPSVMRFYNHDVVSNEWDSDDVIQVRLHLSNAHPDGQEPPLLF